jgi:hypothetical protein
MLWFQFFLNQILVFLTSFIFQERDSKQLWASCCRREERKKKDRI